MKNLLQYIVVLLLYCKTIKSQISTFSNPVLDISSGDVTILRNGANYYLVYADNAASELQIYKSPYLTDFRNAEKGIIYRRPPGYTNFYPTSFLEHQNEFYLYFHMHTPSVSWRMFVVKANDPTNPMGNWSVPVRVLEHVWNNIAHQGAPLQINGLLYFVWSSPSETNGKYGFYIAQLQTPNQIQEPVVLLREPIEDWECYPTGPSFLYSREKVYIIFTSCIENTTTGTSLSSMSIELGMDPLIPSNWKTNSGPVFEGNPEENVYGIRYSEFTKSPDGTETWMMYIAFSNMSDSSTTRIRVEKINWNTTDGSPIFPVAKANGFQQQLPSGEPSKYLNPVSGNIANYSPNAYRVGEDYYTFSRDESNNELVVFKSDKLYDYSNAENAVVYTAAEGLVVNEGRMFEINEEFYLSFYIHSANQGFWLYVSKAENKSNLMESWSTPARLLNGILNGQGFDAVVLHLNDQFYLIWSHPNNDTSYDIYIAPMRSPTEVTEPVVLLKEPKQKWECYTRCINSYPSVFYHKSTAFVIFAASHWDHVDASISYMSIDTGKDPLDVTNWYTSPGPVFTRNDAENVYAIGNAWLTTSPDGLEDWMMYHASDNSSNIPGSRSIRIQKISWDKETGHPLFPKAHGNKHPLAIPSRFEYFTNPITDETSESPAVIRVGFFYYMVLSTEPNTDVVILKSGKLEDFRNAERKIVYSVPDGFLISGSSKLHRVNDQLYIYFSMQEQNNTSKMFVLQAQDPSNPMGVWNANNLIHLAPSWNLPAFQSTLFEHDGSSYLVWVTPNPASGFNSIYIAKMKNATYVLDPINLIRHPTELWECDGGCSNQAPHFIYNEGTAYMVHSVGAVCKAGNALTYMSIGKDMDPLNSVNWVKAEGKVFTENVDQSIFCPAHATFVLSPGNQNETWMVYHATNSPHVDAVKTAYIEKITWDKDTGEPVFPEPHGLHHEQLVPGKRLD